MAVTTRAERNAIREATEELTRLAEENKKLKAEVKDVRAENAYLKGQGGVR